MELEREVRVLQRQGESDDLARRTSDRDLPEHEFVSILAPQRLMSQRLLPAVLWS